MRRFLLKVVGLLLATVFALPARAQPANPAFPSNSIQAKQALSATLQSFGSYPLAALDSPVTLKRLVAELSKRYRDVPTLEEIKELLLLALGPGAMPHFDLIDPDHAPLMGTVFARQTAIREPNPDLARVQAQTWPAKLTHGERVALQSYSGSAFVALNQGLRQGGTVPALYKRVHVRLQSAFQKAQPFDPPVMVSRGVRFSGPQLDKFVQGFRESQKTGKPYVMIGYGSSTVGPNVLPGFRGTVDMHIKATHGLDVYPISLFPQEKEFLLNHASTYRVTKLEQAGGRWVVNLEQIPPKAGGKAVPAGPPPKAPPPGPKLKAPALGK